MYDTGKVTRFIQKSKSPKKRVGLDFSKELPQIHNWRVSDEREVLRQKMASMLLTWGGEKWKKGPLSFSV